MASYVADFAIGSCADCLLEAIFSLFLVKCHKLVVTNDLLVVIEEEIDQLFWERYVGSIRKRESLENAGT